MIGRSWWGPIRQRIPLGRAELLVMGGIVGLLALTLSRSVTAGLGLPAYALPVVWAALAFVVAAILLPARLLARHGYRWLQGRNASFRYWLLLRALVVRDLRARYARTSLGWAWIIAQPLFQMVVYAVLRSILGLSDTSGMNFVIFLYTAILPWNFIATAVNTSAPAVFANAALLKKMSVPREIFVLAAITTAVVDLGMGLGVLAVLITVFNTPVTWHWLWLPALLALAVLLALALGLIVAAVTPFRGDAAFLVPYVMQLWFFLTPVFYSVDVIAPAIRPVVGLNPVAGLVTGFRNVLGAGLPPDLGLLAWSAVFTLLLLGVAWPFFRHMAQYFADMM